VAKNRSISFAFVVIKIYSQVQGKVVAFAHHK